MARYCFCRGQSAGFMIFCELCNEWFHGKCINLVETNAPKGDWYCYWCERDEKVKSSLVKKFNSEVEKVKADLSKKFDEEVAKLQRTESNQVRIHQQQENNEQISLKQDLSQEKLQLQRALEMLKKEYESVKTELADVERRFSQSKEMGVLAWEEEKHDFQQQISKLEQDLILERQQRQQQGSEVEKLAKENEELKLKLLAAKKEVA